eukprot:7292390-Prymnesium_polylepis.1
MQVEIPQGLIPGDQMAVHADGTEFVVVVPDGCYEGDLIEVDVPAVDETPPLAAGTEQVQIAIPGGCFAGDPISVQATWGGAFEVVVPDGCRPGDIIEVDLPTQEAAGGTPGSETTPADAQRADRRKTGEESATEYAGLHRIGGRVNVLRSNGSWTPGTIKVGRAPIRRL